MTYKIKPTSTFKKEYKLAKKRGLDLSLINEVIDLLAQGQTLPEKYNDHDLLGNYKGYRECHIQTDWLLIYQYDNGNCYLYLARTGTHSDLFGKNRK